MTQVVVRFTGRDGHVLAAPNIGIVKQWCKKPEEEYESREHVGFNPPGNNKGRTNERDLRPIKSDQAHAHSVDVTKHLVERDVVGCNPAYPGEVAECLEQITRDQVPNSGCRETIEEEPLTANPAKLFSTSVGLGMKRIEESGDDQSIGPDCYEI